MKNELMILLGVAGVLIIGSFMMGVRVERMTAAEPAPTCPPASPAPPPDLSGALKECADARIAGQLDYIKWRGKHVQQLEACTAALGEAAHALVRRARQ
jgi:hypothetical protein